MSVEEVLSEILRVPCWNVKFTRESSSQEFFGYDQYLHGMIRHSIEFTTKQPLAAIQVGSVRLAYCSVGNKFQAILLKGEETSRIVRAIADELV